jgi:23S rRNA (guanosine2251-2'-O)-methyltransferase
LKEWITGRNPVLECLRARRRQPFRLIVATGVEEKDRMLEILKLAETRRVPLTRVPRQQVESVGENSQGVALEVSAYPYSTLQEILSTAKLRGEPPFILILDVLQNPQNLGTLLRTAEAAGVHGVLIPLAHAVEVTPAVVSASAGASEHIQVAVLNLSQAIDTLKTAGVWVIGLEGGPEAQPVDRVNLDGPLALVVGGEGEGLRALTRRSCDVLVSLPMRGKIDSLNAAVAGSIVVYLALQARQKKV